ncbi:hypothetical protein [Mucilaginibacter gynuensis]|uniref:hypothetical protein n=1 Tax=Mucilaginibacter gynuensis TaxID=1302236 RepID=UPI0031EA7988
MFKQFVQFIFNNAFNLNRILLQSAVYPNLMSYDDSGKDYKCCSDCDAVEEIDFFFNDVKGNGKCDICNGEGEIDDFFRAEVTRFTAKLITFGLDQTEFPDTVDCPKCNATGQCQSCGGNGRVKTDCEEQEIEGDENEVEIHGYEVNDHDSYSDDDEDYEDNDSYSYVSPTENHLSDINPDNPVSSGSNSSIVGIIVIIAVIGVGYALFHRSQPPAATDVRQQPVYNDAPVLQQEALPEVSGATPTVVDSGHVGFLISCDYCEPFFVYEDTMFLGTVPERRFAAGRVCGSSDVLTIAETTGDHIFTIKTSAGESWQQTVKVTLGDCVMIDAQQKHVTSNREDPLENVPIATDMLIVSPEEHSSFDFPRNTNVSWTPMTDVDSYEVELQLADKPYDYTATAFSPMPYANRGISPTTGTSVTVEGMG